MNPDGMLMMSFTIKVNRIEKIRIFTNGIENRIHLMYLFKWKTNTCFEFGHVLEI